MTGAPIPRGADSVVPNEQTDRGNARVSIYAPARRRSASAQGRRRHHGRHRPAEGTVLGPREIGLLAALGRARVQARPRPRVVVHVDRSELREPGTHLDYDSINDGNSYMLAAAVRAAAGAIGYRVGRRRRQPRARSRQVLSEQLVRADLVVTSGGISKGDARRRQADAVDARHGRVRRGRDAAGQAAGLRHGLRRADADHHAAGQPRLGLRLVRGLRAAGDPAHDGPHAVPPPAWCTRCWPKRSASPPGRRQYLRGCSRSRTAGRKVTPLSRSRLAPRRGARAGQRPDHRRGGRDRPQPRRHRPRSCWTGSSDGRAG